MKCVMKCTAMCYEAVPVEFINQAEREFFRKRLENFFVKNPKIKQCEVVGYFVKEGIARQTVFNALNRSKNGQSIKGKVEETRKQLERSKSAKVGR